MLYLSLTLFALALLLIGIAAFRGLSNLSEILEIVDGDAEGSQAPRAAAR